MKTKIKIWDTSRRTPSIGPKARPWNQLPCRLRLLNRQAFTFQMHCNARQSLESSAFPGRAWEREKIWIALVMVAALIAIACSGCNRNLQTDRAKAGSKSEHEHFPVHWPKTIFNATDRLNALRRDPMQTAVPPSIPVEKEWLDLIRWLPELVADSDLSESDFTEIDAWSIKYLALVESKLSKGCTLAELVSVDGVSSHMDSLTEVCRMERERIEKLN